MTEKSIKEKSKDGEPLAPDKKGLIAAACEAYGIDARYVFGSAIRDGVVTIVTVGGKKVRFKAGDKPAPLDQISITGVNPAPKRKPITGPAKK